jgi:hypothetical protein
VGLADKVPNGGGDVVGAFLGKEVVAGEDEGAQIGRPAAPDGMDRLRSTSETVALL